MSIQVSLTIELESPIEGFSNDTVGPISLIVAKGSQAIRRPLTLVADVPTVLPVDGIAPWMIFVFNTHATTAIEVSFGEGTDMVIEHGDPPAMWTGTKIPTLKAVGATGSALAWIIEE